MIEFLDFETREEVSHALAMRLAAVIRSAVATRDEASVVVSGGSTPKCMFQMLSRQELPWRNVTIVPSDERRVPVDHPDSNEGMINAELRRDKALPASIFSYNDANPSPDVVVENINRRLFRLPQPFDAVVLGMGADGHTASLFPDAPGIEATLDSQELCVLQEISRLPTARLSLTVKALLKSRAIDLLMFGQDKRRVYEQACQPGTTAQFPVRSIIHQNKVPVTVWWAP